MSFSQQSSTNASLAKMKDRMEGALWGVYIADALSMPVHWYYDPSQLKQDFGFIKNYESPKAQHPSSIMNLSNTGGHGRGNQQGNIIGDVILKGKRKYWGVPNMHYHHGMQAGENTLNALCARLVTRSIVKSKGVYDSDQFLKDYVDFMTTPDTHNDVYAESYHRDFFKNWREGVPPKDCSKGTEGHNTPSAGGLVTLPAVLMSSLARTATSYGGKSYDRNERVQLATDVTLKHLALTHESDELQVTAKMYLVALANAILGNENESKDADSNSNAKYLQSLMSKIGGNFRADLGKVVEQGLNDTIVVHRVFGPACYITSSLPVISYLAYKHANSFEDAVLANTNAGGENCHRGAALGALMGAAVGKSGIPKRFIDGLKEKDAIAKEVDAFLKAVFDEQSSN